MTSVLGIKINKINLKNLLKQIDIFVHSSKNAYIVTPNPEIILSANKDEELFYILNKADISLADGFGVIIASCLKGHRVKRITGSNLTPLILDRAEKSNWKILVVNNDKGLSDKLDIENYLNYNHPKLKHLVLDVDRESNLNKDNLEIINKFSPQIMFCTFGSPYQEKFIFFNKDKIKNLRLSLAIGGSFDFLTKKIRRAPKILQKIGLEWLFRLIKQPKRIKRIYRATFVFLSKTIKARFNHFQYRKNVACLLFREKEGSNDNSNNNQDIEILIVEREDEEGHWQIPQGGTDGESLEKAARRELEEEVNTNQFKVVKTYKNLHKYLFPSVNMDRERIKMDGFNKYYEYKGQKQGLALVKYYGDGTEIKVNFWEHRSYKWVNKNEFINSVHKVRQKSGKIYLEKLNKYLESTK
ncbi:MAG: WecB/TagA/CpsF family glycosyltransferase [Patescibacteria group bacterium]|jgi:N-acetylglucosaminyldiphosphoundecaprenol N-acetyl-beta-D-mannosaminyltransferase|nr:WecB/TagA/CpsF family glycosyltransferase [Patescibacteria group bacterium]